MAIGWTILSKIVPHGRAWEVAEEMNVSLDAMHRWMRMPLSTENPNATGRVNPIDYAVRLIRAVHKVSPDDAHQIVDVFVSTLAELEAKRDGPAMSNTEIETMLRARARELVQMANALAGRSEK